ncbi:hypothetical protein EIB72_32570 [Burkholderia ambifaria]|uniref:hypothetical protein n=1 Tax=Burkholderia ambifaria TaxID=152480 RepID=UPI0013FD3963|nr:hypothetical protein [Burkholderia ambifaria]NHL71113.1 hypothetical protein [Burkholderia ambifaria]
MIFICRSSMDFHVVTVTVMLPAGRRRSFGEMPRIFRETHAEASRKSRRQRVGAAVTMPAADIVHRFFIQRERSANGRGDRIRIFERPLPI